MKSKELPSLQKQFRSCDIDGDGMISKQDMCHNMKRRGSLTSAKDAGMLVERISSITDRASSNESLEGPRMLSFEQFVIGEIHLRAQVRGRTSESLHLPARLLMYHIIRYFCPCVSSLLNVSVSTVVE